MKHSFLTIRRATVNDLAFLCKAEAACFPFDAWAEDAILSHLESPICDALMACLGEKPCGYLLYQTIAPEFELLRVGTLPEYRGCGAGNALVRALFERAKALGASEGFLEVRASNQAARTLYEKNGYTLCGERKNYYKNPTEHAALYQISLKGDGQK